MNFQGAMARLQSSPSPWIDVFEYIIYHKVSNKFSIISEHSSVGCEPYCHLPIT